MSGLAKRKSQCRVAGQSVARLELGIELRFLRAHPVADCLAPAWNGAGGPHDVRRSPPPTPLGRPEQLCGDARLAGVRGSEPWPKGA